VTAFDRATAERALAVVEAALGDTLTPAARAEALAGLAALLPPPADQAERAEAERDWWGDQAHAVQARAERADRAAIYAEVADRLAADAEQGDKEGFTRIYRRSAAKQVRLWADDLRRLADETPDTTPQAAEDPARIDRLRPEFAEHASVESIDAQLDRARRQERRWHLRIEWLTRLRTTRVAQKERGEWPAAAARQDGAQQ
jgi:hypothetical protein